MATKPKKKKNELVCISYVDFPDGTSVRFDSLPEEKKAEVRKIINERVGRTVSEYYSEPIHYDEATRVFADELA